MDGPSVPPHKINFEVVLFSNSKLQILFELFQINGLMETNVCCYSCLKGDGIVVKGQAYGIRGIRVDGNDALAVYNAVHAAREMAISESRPVLIEVRLNFFPCLSYYYSFFFMLY